MATPPEYLFRADGTLDINPRSTMLQRLPVRASADLALDHLHEKLAISAVIYERHGDAGRVGASMALREIVDYLGGQGLPASVMLPLYDLAVGLDELDRRVVTPLLAPKTGRGAPPKPEVRAREDVFLAVVMECCVRHVRDVERAQSFLSTAAQQAERMVKHSKLGLVVTQGRLKKARETVTEEMSGDFRRFLFDALMEDAMSAPSILEWVKGFVVSGWVPVPQQSR